MMMMVTDFSMSDRHERLLRIELPYKHTNKEFRKSANITAPFKFTQAGSQSRYV